MLIKSINQFDSGSYHPCLYPRPPTSFSTTQFHSSSLHFHSIFLNTSNQSHYSHSHTKIFFDSLRSIHFNDLI